MEEAGRYIYIYIQGGRIDSDALILYSDNTAKKGKTPSIVRCTDILISP